MKLCFAFPAPQQPRPWRQVARLTGALKYLSLGQNVPPPGAGSGEDYKAYAKIPNHSHVSNVQNTLSVADMANGLIAKGGCGTGGCSPEHSASAVDVQDPGADFWPCQHKVYGTTGIGVLYGQAELLERTCLLINLGGDMIEYVAEQDSTFCQMPQELKQGLPMWRGAVGLKLR